MANVDKRLNDLEKAVNPPNEQQMRIFVIYDTDDPNLFELPSRPGELFTAEQIEQIKADMGLNIGTIIRVKYGDDLSNNLTGLELEVDEDEKK